MNDPRQPVLPPELDSALTEFFAAPPPDPAFAQRLEAHLRRRQAALAPPPRRAAGFIRHPRRSYMALLRGHPLLAILAALLALLILSGIAYAIAHIPSFIPNVGFVEDVQAVLATPLVVERSGAGPSGAIPSNTGASASQTATPQNAAPEAAAQERQGITLTVQEVVSAADQLLLTYRVSGLPANLFDPEHVARFYDQQSEPVPTGQVRLADGALLAARPGSGCGGSSDGVSAWMTCQLSFPALPAGVERFTLEIPRLQNALPGELPEDWTIAVQLSAPAAASAGVAQPGLQSPPVAGVTLQLLHAGQTNGQNAFQFGLEWQGEQRRLHHTAPVSLQDPQGHYYLLTGIDSRLSPSAAGYSAALPALVSGPLPAALPLTFRLDWIALSVNAPAGLHFDPGAALQLGQDWPLDVTLDVGGLALHFTHVYLKPGPQGTSLLEFDLETPPDVLSLTLQCDGASMSESGLAPGAARENNPMVARVYLDAQPQGPLDLTVSEVVYKVTGPWEISWQAPANATPAAFNPTALPTRLAPPAAVPAPDQPLLAELQTLLKLAYPAQLYAPGWVHQQIEVETVPAAGLLYSPEQPPPPERMRTDTWYQIGADGYVHTMVNLFKAPDGELLSTDLTSGPYHFSFPEKQGGISQDLYLEGPVYDLHLLDTFAGYLQLGGRMRRDEINLSDGSACRAYQVTQNFDPPTEMWGEPERVQSITYAACFDPSGGRLRQVSARLNFSDGSSRVSSLTRFLLTETTAAPAPEVQQLLDALILP